MKAFREFSRKRFGKLASSFSLTEKLIEQSGRVQARKATGKIPVPLFRRRRAQPNRYPDLGLSTSLPPSRLVTSGLSPQASACVWESVARNSGATVPDSHGVPGHLAAITDGPIVHRFSKSRLLLRRRRKFAKENLHRGSDESSIRAMKGGRELRPALISNEYIRAQRSFAPPGSWRAPSVLPPRIGTMNRIVLVFETESASRGRGRARGRRLRFLESLDVSFGAHWGLQP